MPKRTHPLEIAGLLSAGALLALGLLGGCGRKAQPQAQPKPSAATVIKPLWLGGRSYVYGLELASQATLPTSDEQLDFALRGALEVTALRVSGEQTELGVVLRDIRLTSKRPDTDGGFAKLEGELGAPALLTLSAGRLSELRLAPTLSVFAGTIERALLAALQLPES